MKTTNTHKKKRTKQMILVSELIYSQKTPYRTINPIQPLNYRFRHN